jgi:hypothetical protein
VQSTSPWVDARFAGSPGAVMDHQEQYRQAGLKDALCLFESENLDDLLRPMRVFAKRTIPPLATSDSRVSFATGSM